MNARKKLLTILPVFASLAVIGSGFSVWYFGNGTTTVDQSMTLGIEQVAEVGSITTAKGLKLIFDQTKEGRNSNGNGFDLGDGPNGIYLEYETNGDKTTSAVYTSKSDETNIDYTDYVENEFNYQFITTITVSNDLAAYFKIEYKGWEREVAIKPSSFVTTFTSPLGESEFNWENVVFAYNENKEPTNETEYKTLSSIIEKSSISVYYTVSLVKTSSSN